MLRSWIDAALFVSALTALGGCPRPAPASDATTDADVAIDTPGLDATDTVACMPNGARCSIDPDCCSGSCSATFCSSPCAPEGAICMAGEDCCSGSCRDGGCGRPCRPGGAACDTGDQCCSGMCPLGVCKPM